MQGDAGEDGYWTQDERLCERVFDARERGREVLDSMYSRREGILNLEILKKSINLLQVDVEICKACENYDLIF